MIRVFLDTNVLIDILGRRDDESLNRDSAQAVSNALFLGMDLKASAISVATLNYILKKLPPATLMKVRCLFSMICFPAGIRLCGHLLSEGIHRA